MASLRNWWLDAFAFDPRAHAGFGVLSSGGDDFILVVHADTFVEFDSGFGFDFGFAGRLLAGRVGISDLERSAELHNDACARGELLNAARCLQDVSPFGFTWFVGHC